MWNRDQNSSAPTLLASAEFPPPRPASLPETAFIGGGAIIGETMRITGDIFSKDELQVNGEVEGSLESESRLTVGPTGKADASVKAAEVVVAGAVNGNIQAVERIVLRKGANLVGDVKTAGIVIEDGAYFKGGIDITQPAQTHSDAHQSSKSAAR
ncbi:MAG TPA: polymer-forming cytoskeletal protein [Bryobacteraceae bacterium]|nr:polymer-forming cytoskeletal protein [Bryobacteraceae bacterium]